MFNCGSLRLGEDMSTRSRTLHTPSTAIQCLSDVVLDKIRTPYLIAWTYAKRFLDTIPVRDISGT